MSKPVDPDAAAILSEEEMRQRYTAQRQDLGFYENTKVQKVLVFNDSKPR